MQDLSAELSGVNSQLMFELAHSTAWPPLAAVALAASQSPETLRQLASLSSNASSTTAAAAAAVVPSSDHQQWSAASAPLPAAERHVDPLATPPAEPLGNSTAGSVGQEAQQHQWQQADRARGHDGAAAVRGSRSMDLSRSFPRPQWAPNAADTAARQPPLLQQFALATGKDSSPGVQRPQRTALPTSITAELVPQRSYGSAGSIVQSSRFIGKGCLDYGSAVDMQQRRSLH